MALLHLRYLIEVAAELCFACGKGRLHIEQLQLSCAIKELKKKLCVVLFVSTTRSIRLTRAGKSFLDLVPRIITALQQARDNVKAVHGQLRIVLSDGITPSRLPALLAVCCLEEPESEIRLTEVPLSQQITGLQDALFDVGFTRAHDVGDAILTIPVVAVPTRHHLLKLKKGAWGTPFRGGLDGA
ncbi:LysR family transcriptional regulator [Pectobacterium cacticida]